MSFLPCPDCGCYLGAHTLDCAHLPALSAEEMAARRRAEELHRAECHPGYLYATTVTSAAAYPQDGNDHWHRNRARGSSGVEWMGTHEVTYWQRRKDAPHVRGFWLRYPNTIEQLLTDAGLRNAF